MCVGKWTCGGTVCVCEWTNVGTACGLVNGYILCYCLCCGMEILKYSVCF